MAQVCPNCGAAVGINDTHCPACQEVLDPNVTILPPRFRAEVPPQRVQTEPVDQPHRSPTARSIDPAERPERDEPSPTPAARRKPRIKTPSPVARHAPPQPQYGSPPPPPPPPYVAPYYAPPVAPPAPAPTPSPTQPGGFRGALIRLLGGHPEPAPQAAPHPAPAPVWPPPAQPGPPSPYPGSFGPPQAPLSPAPFTPPYGGEIVTPPQVQSPYHTPIRPKPVDLPVPAEDEDDDGGLTRMMGGADVARLKVPQRLYVLQILDQSGQWLPWSTISGAGLKVGRSDKGAQFPDLITMAARHMRVAISGRKILIEDLGALNGIFLKASGPIELDEGRRFRIGAQIFEFHLAEPAPEVEPLRGEDGEEFWSRDQDAPAYLDFIRPDGSAGVRYPITKAEPTILGREGKPGRPVDLALPGAEWVSGQHAQIRRQGDAFLLEDLGSRNGTFVQIRGTAEVEAEDVLLLGKILLRVVEHAGH